MALIIRNDINGCRGVFATCYDSKLLDTGERTLVYAHLFRASSTVVGDNRLHSSPFVEDRYTRRRGPNVEILLTAGRKSTGHPNGLSRSMYDVGLPNSASYGAVRVLVCSMALGQSITYLKEYGQCVSASFLCNRKVLKRLSSTPCVCSFIPFELGL